MVLLLGRCPRVRMVAMAVVVFVCLIGCWPSLTIRWANLADVCSSAWTAFKDSCTRIHGWLCPKASQSQGTDCRLTHSPSFLPQNLKDISSTVSSLSFLIRFKVFSVRDSSLYCQPLLVQSRSRACHGSVWLVALSEFPITYRLTRCLPARLYRI